MQFDLGEHLRSKNFLERLSNIPRVDVKSIITTQTIPQKRSTPKRNNTDAKLETKFEERVRNILMTICSHRKRLKYDQVYKYTTAMIRGYSIKPDRGREATLINILFAIIYGCRKNGIYIDPLLVSEELGFSYKKLMKNIFTILPYSSSTSEFDAETIRSLTSVNLSEICEEYVDVILRGDSKMLEAVSERSLYIYNLIERTNVLSTEKQFCVTPAKIVAYVIMEMNKDTKIHEHLKFPKLFFEKVKRVVNRAEKIDKE
jgi:hypothetical protein